RRRIRAVVAEPVALQVGVAGEPAGVVVQALARTRRAVRRALAALVDAVAAAAGGDLAHVGGDVGHRPVDELAARVRDRDFDVVPAGQRRIGGRVRVDAEQRGRAGTRRQVVPGQLRIAVAAETAGRAERELRGNRTGVVEAAAVDAHGVPPGQVSG